MIYLINYLAASYEVLKALEQPELVTVKLSVFYTLLLNVLWTDKVVQQQ